MLQYCMGTEVTECFSNDPRFLCYLCGAGNAYRFNCLRCDDMLNPYPDKISLCSRCSGEKGRKLIAIYELKR